MHVNIESFEKDTIKRRAISESFKRKVRVRMLLYKVTLVVSFYYFQMLYDGCFALCRSVLQSQK